VTSKPEEPIGIRAFRTADWPAFAELVDESVADGFNFMRRFADDFADWSRESEIWLTAWRENELAAFGGLTADPYVETARVGRLRHIYVRRKFRRLGVGGALVRALERAATNAYDVIRLRTDTVDAAQFYERLGYEVLLGDAHATHQRNVPPRACPVVNDVTA
jgi:GNAT superfamily N-acetyltransferase